MNIAVTRPVAAYTRRGDGAIMVPQPGSPDSPCGTGPTCFVNVEFEGVRAGCGRGGRLRLAALPPSTPEPRDWPDRAFAPGWSPRTRWSRPTIVQDHRWPLAAQAPKILHVVPAAEGFDIENRRDEWRLNLMSRSRWQHPPSGRGWPSSPGPDAPGARGRMRWFDKRVEAGPCDKQYSYQLYAEDIRDTGAVRDRHWRADRILAEPDRPEVTAWLKVHGHPLSAFKAAQKWRWRETVKVAPPAWQCATISTRSTGWRHPPDWESPITFREPDYVYRALPRFGVSDRPGVAIGWPLKSPWLGGSDSAKPRPRGIRTPAVPGKNFHGSPADKGIDMVLEEERKFERALKGRAKRFLRTDFAEPEGEEEDNQVVAAFYKLQREQMRTWDRIDADAENAAMLDDVEECLGGTDRRLFEMARDGLSQEEMAAELGVNQATVSRKLKIICGNAGRRA